MSDGPSDIDNQAEREAQIDEIIARLERLEIEAMRLWQLAARLKAVREQPPEESGSGSVLKRDPQIWPDILSWGVCILVQHGGRSTS